MRAWGRRTSVLPVRQRTICVKRNKRLCAAHSIRFRTTTPVPPPPHPTYNIDDAIRAALDEDSGALGDVTTRATISPETQATATFLAKADGVLAGIAVADRVLEMVDPELVVEWSGSDGDKVTRGVRFGVVRGKAASILVAERVALNFMQRMSGIATATAEMVARVQDQPARVLETRKTAPGLRLLDKWAVLIGGGSNHRMGLFDMLMIKDNHIEAAGGLQPAIERAEGHLREQRLDLGIEVETRTLGEVQQVVQYIQDCKEPCMVTRVMLDNMTVADMSTALQLLRDGGCDVETEASGNVTVDSIASIAATGVDFISCGALTHSVRALDISLNVTLDLVPESGTTTR